jgi:conjugal transfer mating pair stabilization protein TraG
MSKKSFIRKLKKQFRRSFLKRNVIFASILVLVIGVFWIMMQPKNSISATAYTPLLEVIAKGESRGNYNAYFGNVANQELKFTHMTIADVLDWQKKFVEAGNPSSAVGRYQIIQPTLKGLVKELKLTAEERFDEDMQNKLAITLIERRGSIKFVNNDLPAEDFAHQLSKEWAALPKVVGESPEASYYAGDGLNRSLIDTKTSLNAVQEFKDRADKE